MSLEPAWKKENRPARILVVDDDAEIIETLSYALSNQGYEVLIARDGNQGLAMAENAAPTY